MNIILVHNIVETMMNGCSIIFNAFLLYLVRYHSSFGTPVYQVMLAVDASLDLILSVFVLFGQPVSTLYVLKWILISTKKICRRKREKLERTLYTIPLEVPTIPL